MRQSRSEPAPPRSYVYVTSPSDRLVVTLIMRPGHVIAFDIEYKP